MLEGSEGSTRHAHNLIEHSRRIVHVRHSSTVESYLAVSRSEQGEQNASKQASNQATEKASNQESKQLTKQLLTNQPANRVWKEDPTV